MSINTLCLSANQIFNGFPSLFAVGFCCCYFLNSYYVHFYSKSPQILSTSVRSGIYKFINLPDAHHF